LPGRIWWPQVAVVEGDLRWPALTAGAILFPRPVMNAHCTAEEADVRLVGEARPNDPASPTDEIVSSSLLAASMVGCYAAGEITPSTIHL